jgi:hypothetical protein
MKRRCLLACAAALATATIAGSLGAQQPVRSGTIALNTRSVGFIVGVEWGSGTMTLANRRSYQLRVRTFKAGMIGIEGVGAQGFIYNLNPRRPQDVAGTYASIGAGLTIGGGIGAQRMQNEKGVIIDLTETAVGAAAKLAASGLVIDLVR